MRKHNGSYLYTPSDLVEFLSSPFATWMTRRFVDDPSAAVPDADPPELLSLREQAQRHEREDPDTCRFGRGSGSEGRLAEKRIPGAR